MGLASWFRRSSAPMLGVDIGASSIKLVELGQTPQGVWVLERCARAPLEKGWVADGRLAHFEAVAQVLCGLLERPGRKTKPVALALPHQAVITQRVVLPADLGEEEMASQLEFEAERCMPFPLEEVCLDFGVIGPNAKSADDLDVLLVAARRERVEERQRLAKAVGLQARVLDIETYALRLACTRLMALLPQDAQDLVAVVKIGGMGSHVQVVCHGDLLFERELAAGGDLLTQMLAQHLGCSWAEAEALKCSAALPEDCSAAVLRPFLRAWAAELARALQFFGSSSPQQRLQQMLVSGGSAGLPGLTQAVAEQLSLPVAVANPFQGMHPGLRLHPVRPQEAPAYATACGLAMRGAGL